MVRISGDSEEKDFFGQVVKDSDVVVCTAQILYNAMINMEEAKRVELSGKHHDGTWGALKSDRSFKPSILLADITLLIIDECHHTKKQAVYNQIMGCYVEKKLNGAQRLPQVLGLTASLGTGGEKTTEKAVEHILQVGVPPSYDRVGCRLGLFLIIIISPLSDLCQPGLRHSFHQKLHARAGGEGTQTRQNL